MEVLGHATDIHPGLFEEHIGDSWGPRSTGVSPLYSRSGVKSQVDFATPYPRLFNVSHPSSTKDKAWQVHHLELAARHLQCRQLLPALDNMEDNEVQCIAFEHITISLNVDSGKKSKYGAVVLFPPSLKRWEQGTFHVSKQQNIDHSPDILDVVMAQGGDSADMDVATWEASLKLMSAAGKNLTDPFLILESLWIEALRHWKLSPCQVEWRRLQPEQQLRSIIHQGASTIIGILGNMATANDAYTVYKKDNKREPSAITESSRFIQLEKDFTVVKQQLERHLPTLQHHTDVIRVNQQVRLAETQLEESRKAIQQADTIKRLTILAFVYIPIQTVASVFGMNVREFDPDPSVWTFGLLTVLLLAITL
ncbi:MAG: hypothetical protein M1831_004278 [Alyxoria varia]|nr:MAG: hypothetical protein M1831_004278 [Alyxoria varia]